MMTQDFLVLADAVIGYLLEPACELLVVESAFFLRCGNIRSIADQQMPEREGFFPNERGLRCSNKVRAGQIPQLRRNCGAVLMRRHRRHRAGVEFLATYSRPLQEEAVAHVE